VHIDLTELRNREKYISCRKHPRLDLLIWNYKASCAFDGAWDTYTLMSRGLITDTEGLVIARPFPKFFNVGEKDGTQLRNLPSDIPEIREKLDGSLGIQYYDGEKVCIATRGTFDSDQGLWATEWMAKYKRWQFLGGHTYLYEIVYPENRIVVDYGDRAELILLAVINTHDGCEVDIDREGATLDLETPALINTDVCVLAETVKNMSIASEGFVLRYPDGLRVKMKGWEYIRLHKAIFQISTTAIWEAVKLGDNLAVILDRLPEAYHPWVTQQGELIENHHAHLVRVKSHLREVIADLPTRKEQATYINRHHPEVAWMMSAILDNKDMSEKFWKVVKPEHAKPCLT